MKERKQELCKLALEYLLEHGMANVSLRPMAAALKTSPRILMFHFKSKEGLLREVFAELNAQLQRSFLSVVSRDTGRPHEAPLKRFWTWATSNQKSFARLKLIYELQIIAVQNPVKYAGYLQTSSSEWQALTLGALSESVREKPLATLCVAVFDGLFLELMSTGDRRRTTQALDRFIEIVAPLTTPA
jgi:AcrR family transcriptional regulator